MSTMWRKLLVFVTAWAASVSSNPDIVMTLNGDISSSFNQLVVDNNTGRVYIGAVNTILQLSHNLDVEYLVHTGPLTKPASDQCDGCREKNSMDVVNKALLIDYDKNRLINCGSNGLCSVRKLSNISEVREVPDPVVSNATSSCVVFIAPGPQISQVMYVGATYTHPEVPAVSSRSLEDGSLFQIARTGTTSATRMFVNTLSREVYPINYVFGFSTEGFSYFLTTQQRSQNSDWHSKLVRVCHNDENYYSYTEIPIKCSDFNLVQAAFVGKPGSKLASKLGITADDEVLFVAFSLSKSFKSREPSDLSALCVYSLKSIRRKFMRNIRSCFSGNGTRGLDFISPSNACVATKQVVVGEEFCGSNINTPLGGEQPVDGTHIAVFYDRLTAIAAIATGDNTVVFAGTAKGHLKKFAMESPNGREYDDIVIDEGVPVNKDMFFDAASTHLYVMTTRRLSKVKLHECSAYKSCFTCIEKDPFCEWCSLENKCSLRSECQADKYSSISYRSGLCTNITHVTPSKVQLTTVKTLDLIVKNLPVLDEKWLCHFTALGRSLSTNAIRKSYGVVCPTPRTDTLPSIPIGEHKFTAKLSVRRSQGPDFAATNLTFFDCSLYKSCTQCVSSPFPCDWCIDGHRCTHDTSENCGIDILVTGISRIGPSYRSGPSFCPAIKSSINEILIPFGVKKTVKVKVDIRGQFIVQTRFFCQFIIEGRVSHVNGYLLADTVYCDTVEFTYASNAPNVTASFAVIWGGSKPLDNPNDTHILIYRCGGMADSCEKCLVQPDRFGCGWCPDTNQCEVQEQCRTPGVWLKRTQSCPEPAIDTVVRPHINSLNGTTTTTEGNNFERNESDSTFFDCGKTGSVQCPNITRVTPNQLQRTSVRSLNLVVENLPIIDEQLLCAFTALDRTILTNATRTQYGVVCKTPSTDTLPPIPVRQHNFTAKLSLRSCQGPDFAATNLTFFDCSLYESCTQCVSSPFPCDWCIDGHRCTHDTSENCRNDILVNGVSRIGPSYRSSPSFCPAIKSSINEILLPFGVKKAVKVKVDIRGQFIVQTRFFCQFIIEGRVSHVNGYLLADTVYCDAVEFTYASNAPNVTASFAVIWGGSKPLDNPNDTHILIYRCGGMADSCEKCLVQPDRFGCGWCPDTNQCEVQEQCRTPGVWLKRTQSCPEPAIDTVVRPHINSLNGTTTTTEGNNFERNESDSTFFDCGKTGSVQCPNITRVTPNQLQRTSVRSLNLVVENLPIIDEQLLCAFTALDRTILTNATRTQYGVVCKTPSTDTLPPIPVRQHNFTAKLSLRSCQGPDFAATNLTFFDCSLYESCTQCVSSPFPCDWCIDGHRCTHDTSENCRNDILVNGVSRIGPSYRSSPSFCPAIKSSINEILLPFGVKKAVKVKVDIRGQFIVQTRFFCQFIIEGRVSHVNGYLLADTVYCDAVEFTYASNAPNVTASFAVIWGGSKPLDNPNDTHILIYRCGGMADSCEKCLVQPDRFGCGWCPDTNQCEVQEQCRTPGVWLKRTQSCPEPAIDTVVRPHINSLNGTTTTTEGNNFERNESDSTFFDCGKTGSVQCPNITRVTPNQLQRTSVRSLNLVVENLPIIDEQLLCAFTALDRTILTNATRTQYGVVCKTPSTDTLPPIPVRQHNFTAKLSLRSCQGPDFAATNLTFFDCSLYESCTQCVSSPFPCDWCIDGHRCTHDTSENCRNDILVNGVSRIGPSYRSSPSFCPAIKSSINEILLPFGVKKAVKVKVDIRGQFIVQTRFFCQFIIEGRVSHVNGYLLADTVYCDAVEFTYASNAPNVTASFAVIWGGSKPLDNPNDTHILIYRCGGMADSCEKCRVQPDRFGCGWCPDTNQCEVQEQCRTPGVWLKRTQSCPEPAIDTVVRPHINSLNGTTTTTEGNNFERNESDSTFFDCGKTGSVQCPNITRVTPNQLQRTSVRSLNLVVENLPVIDEQLLCAFTALDRTILTNATRTQYGVVCKTPSTDTLPPIPIGQHYFTAKLSLRSSQGPDFAATNLTFYDCSLYKSCTQCVSSPFPCDWCIDGHHCTHDTSENCRNDILVTGVSRIGPNYRSGPSFCPAIKSSINEIIIPFGVKKAVKVKVDIRGQFIMQTRFFCQFIIEGRVSHVNGQLLADTVYCDAVEFTYASNAPNVTASFAVIWGGSKPLDNPNDTHILIYRCDGMADSCEKCRVQPDRFGCGWCPDTNQCEVQEQCRTPGVWLKRSRTCPKP